jgi:CBS domain-containing protein
MVRHDVSCCIENRLESFGTSYCTLIFWLYLANPPSNIRLHALPVVDAKHGNLVGIVTAKDVMRDVIKMTSKALPSEEKFSQEMMKDISDLAA